jgi:excisionase family DNA binding protein
MSATKGTKAKTSRRGLLLIDAREVARRLGQSEQTVRRLVAAGKLPKAIVIDGTSRRWRPDDIKAWIAAGRPDHNLAESARHQRATAGGWYSKFEQGSGSDT